MRTRAGAAVLAIVLASGCAGQQGPGAAELLGTVGGAVLGGVVGNKIGDGSGQKIATVIAAMAGGLAGNWIGRNVDENVRRTASAAEREALERGESVHWTHGADSGRVEIVGTRPDTATGETCREFHHTVSIGGREQQAYGLACRDAAGDWRVRG